MRTRNLISILLIVFTFGTLTLADPEDAPTDGHPKLQIRMNFSYSTNARTKNSVHSVEYDPVLNSLLADAIATENEGARNDLIRSRCMGLSEDQQIQFGVLLSSRLSDIYDYSQADNGPNRSAVVNPDDQWTTLREGGVAGVCRHTASTVAQTLLLCGISFDRIRIHGFRTQKSGHQIISVDRADGSQSSINWSEWVEHKSDDPSVVGQATHDIENTGIFEQLYDANGKLIGQRTTALGALLDTAAGGHQNDPFYTPALQMLEIQYGTLSGNYFQGTTDIGDQTEGGSFRWNLEDGILIIDMGLTYATNLHEKTQNTEAYDQRILYSRNLIAIHPEKLFKFGKYELKVYGEAGFEGNFAPIHTLKEGKDEKRELNADGIVRLPLEGGASLQLPSQFKLSASGRTWIAGNWFKSSLENKKGRMLYFFPQRTFLLDTTLEFKKFSLNYQRNKDAWLNQHVFLGGYQNKKKTFGVQAGYVNYVTPGGYRQGAVVGNMTQTVPTRKAGTFRVDVRVQASERSAPSGSAGIRWTPPKRK